jgi:hypothetical protein
MSMNRLDSAGSSGWGFGLRGITGLYAALAIWLATGSVASACPLNPAEARLLETWPSGSLALSHGMSPQALAALWIEGLQKDRAMLAAGPAPGENPEEFRCFLETKIERDQCNIRSLTTEGRTCW